MTTPSLMPAPRQKFTDNNGAPLVNGMLFTYAAGTSTPLAAYQDAAGTVPHPNPIRLDARGEATVYFIGNYKIDVKTAAGNQVTGYPVDNFHALDVEGVLSTSITTLLASLLSSAGASLVGFVHRFAGSVLRTVQSKLRESYSVMDCGALGQGADETALIQAAVDALPANGELVFPAGYNFGTRRIVLSGKSNFSIRIDGRITNLGAKAGGGATDTNVAQRGLNATFYIVNCDHFKIYGAGSIANGYREAFCIGENLPDSTAAPCTDFDISVDVIGNGTNDNIHANRIRYCSRFSLRNMRLESLTKKPAWVNAATQYYYNWAETLLLWDCSDFDIRGVTSRNGAMNGIYVGSNCSSFTITDNDLEHNAGSGLQLAWSSFGNFPSSFNIIENRAKFNRADGYDLNNTGPLIDLYGSVIGNLSYYNGWGTEDTAATAYTNDGSGIGTFINLKKVTISGNVDVECARTGGYFITCFDCAVSGNIINKMAAASQGDGIYTESCTNMDISHNNVNVISTRAAYKVYSTGAGNLNVKAANNYFNGQIQFAGGPYVDCNFNYNKVLSSLQVVMAVSARGNTILVSGAGENGVSIGNSTVVVSENRITAPNFGLVCANFSYVTLEDNYVTGGNGGIRVDTAQSCRISKNTGVGQGAPGIHLLGNSDGCEISMNAGSSVTGNSIRVEVTCTNTQKWGNRDIAGGMAFAGTYGINF